ncbi:LLM class flavin-dependent oxidoreductase [Alicyclobacillus contaminans]|uniref:LLM class flavin-dependent oxidoreductase n=1 Tax=Alicyclobacillus contaminans TaxID=392016 RepID=UPI0004077040|nr:LLM class flavin-dependent oxidoreductase [Alicyclobacillus contaminans]
MTQHHEDVSSVEVGWFLPTSGDGAFIGLSPERAPTLDYLTQVAQAAEDAGFTFALIPTGNICTDAWLVGAAVAARTQRLKPLVAMRPGLIAPVLAARMADVYLMWAEPLDWIRTQIQEVEFYRAEQKRYEGIDRKIRYGLRAQVVVREREEDAWEAAHRMISRVSPDLLELAKVKVQQTDATNQKRQNELWRQSQERDFVIGPNLWAGLTAVRGGGAVAVVGTPEQVADRLLEFVDIGISSFVLSGYPHLEEATRFGELVLPRLREKLAQRQTAAPVV